MDPYPHQYELSHPVGEIRERVELKGLTGETFSTAGRVMAIRGHGRTSFLDLVDDGQRLQCQVRVDVVGGDTYAFFRRFVERGDFVGVRGGMFYTRMGELTLQVEGLTLLS